MNQSKLESFIETCINTAIGFLVALASQLVVFPMVGIDVPISTNLEVGAWFTVISVARGYVIRRWFNARLKAAAHSLSKMAPATAEQVEIADVCPEYSDGKHHRIVGTGTDKDGCVVPRPRCAGCYKDLP